MKNIFILLVCLFVSFQISAQTRQKDSHEHGAANLMLVIEGDKLQIGIERDISFNSIAGSVSIVIEASESDKIKSFTSSIDTL